LIGCRQRKRRAAEPWRRWLFAGLTLGYFVGWGWGWANGFRQGKISPKRLERRWEACFAQTSTGRMWVVEDRLTRQMVWGPSKDGKGVEAAALAEAERLNHEHG
jgi:hypothetical protein